ncbi:hypothetical protein WA158_006238 [Blastocystis sp. Blastoise]
MAASLGKTLMLITIYIAIWSSSPIWVKLSHADGNEYNNKGPLLIVEITKLFASLIIIQIGNPSHGIKKCMKFSQGIYLLLPAFLYLVVNVANWDALKYLNPATCSLLMNLKLLSTGILTEIIFRQKLGLRKWISLIIITIGACLAQVSDNFSIDSIYGVLLMLIHCLCSSLASVYFTWLLKNQTLSFGLWEKNAWLYFFGIITNICVLIVTDKDVLLGRDIKNYNSAAIMSVVVFVTGGISVSYILKYLDAIYKEICSVLLVFVQIVMQVVLFNDIPNKYLISGFIVVVIGVVMYNYDLITGATSKNQENSSNDQEEKKNVFNFFFTSI